MIGSRFAYQAGAIDLFVDLAASGRLPTDIIELRCPACPGPVFVPRDSDRERVDCACCELKLVTRRDVAGVVGLAEIEIGGE